MAIIKCPECGHQVSDKAPVCPSCGVEIAGKTVKCPQCGEVYFKDQAACPNCHHVTFTPNVTPRAEEISYAPDQQSVTEQSDEQPLNASPKTVNEFPTNGQSSSERPLISEPKKKGHAVLIVSFILALIVCAVCFYFYNDAKTSKEREAYDYAMVSSDPLVLQSYLDTYKDAPEAHRDSIQAHLQKIQQTDQDWTNAVVSGSKSDLEVYLAKHPDSPHKADALHKIDSLDWLQAKAENTQMSYSDYLREHADGDHIDEATDALNALKAKTVQPEEQSAINTIFRRFFQSITSKDEEGLTSTVSTFLTSFLGKADATKADVASLLQKLYKEDITSMNWRINKDYKIDKKEVGDNQYEYTVQFSVEQQIERTDPTKEKAAKYRIKAKVSPDGKISEFNMVKILE